MSILERENTTDAATTERWSWRGNASDQTNPATRRVALDVFMGELETRAIERNREFYATIVERLVSPRGTLIDAHDLDD